MDWIGLQITEFPVEFMQRTNKVYYSNGSGWECHPFWNTKKNQLNFKLKQNCCLGSSKLGVGSNKNLKLQSL